MELGELKKWLPRYPGYVVRPDYAATMLTQPPEPEGEYEPPLDPGIEHIVKMLRAGGVETIESCQGGEGHSYPEPTVCFCGGASEGFRALAWALEHGLRVNGLRRVWSVIDGAPTGPEWQLTFY